MSLAVLADHMASKGRNGDTMLVHMAPEEVAGLHALALKHGGSLTINPETGLPEAFSLKGLLKSILPMVAGFALGPAGLGLMSAMQAGLTVGAVAGLAKGSLKEGIMAGLGAYGGANLGAAFTGAESAGASAAAADAAKTAGTRLAEINAAAAQGMAEPIVGEAANQFVQNAAKTAYSDFAAKPFMEQAAGSFQALKSAPGPIGGFSSLARPAMYALAPAAEQMLAPPNVGLPSIAQNRGMYRGYTFDPYGGTYIPQEPVYAAGGGLMGSSGIVALADGGTPPPLATREQVLQAYKSNPLAVTNPDEEAIKYWMGQGLGSFNDVVNQTRAANPMLAQQIDAARAVAQPTPLPLSTQGYNFSAVAANPNAPATISGTAPAGYNYAAAKPTDEIGSQINDIYRNVLNREAETEGLNYWMGRYEAGLSMPEIEAQIRQIKRDIGVSAPNRPTPPPPVTSGADTTYTPADLPAAPVISDPRVTLGTPFQPTAPTMSEVKSAYEQGGGSTKMPVITDIKPTDRTYTQNQAFAELKGYLTQNPNALYGDVVAFARGKGIPEMQARAAYNEFRFSDLKGGSSQAYDYLMGRGAYPVKPFTPTGELMRPYAEAVLGAPENIKAKRLIFDPATQRYVRNPQFVERTPSTANAPIRDQAGNPVVGNTESYFKANPDVYQEWLKGATGMTADAYARYHWETFGQKEGRKGWTETTGGGRTGNTDVPGGKAGGLMDIASAAARGGNVQQYNLGGYSDGGRLLRGPGDGVSDSIPATIGNRQPARLADGEFVVPARIVSEIGNGSTEAGARKLYAMMDRVQRARAKTTGKGKVAKNTKAEQYLPA
jgi:hypothetical protein